MSQPKSKVSAKSCFGVFLFLLVGGGFLLIIFSVLGYPVDNFIIPLFWCGLVPGIVTVVFSFPLLIPGWRRGMQSNSEIRYLTVLLFSILALLTLYGIFTWLVASATQLFGDPNLGMHGFGPTAYDKNVTRELWWRQAVPLRSCFSSELEICAIADERMQNVEAETSIKSSLIMLGISFLFTLPSIFILLFFSRPKKSTPV